MNVETLPVIIVGAGPAGLATSQQLNRRGINHVVLEKGAHVGQVWRDLYDNLTLHTGRHLSHLPGMAFPKGTPVFPTREQFVAYLDAYAAHFQLPVRTNVHVQSIDPCADGWLIHTSAGDFKAVNIVCATGIVSSPKLPVLSGMEQFEGVICHAVEYKNPTPYKDKRVLVVGVGNTGGEIAPEIADLAAATDVCVRSGALVVPKMMMGIPIQYHGWVLSIFPRWIQRLMARATAKMGTFLRGPSPFPPPQLGDCPDVPLIGFHLSDAIKNNKVKLRPGIAQLLPKGARFVDGEEAQYDHIVFATGYSAHLDWLASSVTRDACGFAARSGRVQSAAHAGLFFVGHNYDSKGGLYNLSKDAKIVGRKVANQLR